MTTCWTHYISPKFVSKLRRSSIKTSKYQISIWDFITYSPTLILDDSHLYMLLISTASVLWSANYCYYILLQYNCVYRHIRYRIWTRCLTVLDFFCTPKWSLLAAPSELPSVQLSSMFGDIWSDGWGTAFRQFWKEFLYLSNQDYFLF